VDGSTSADARAAERPQRRTGAGRGERPTVAVLGHYGRGNLGDEATIEAFIQSLRATVPEARLIGFSLGPEDTEARFGVPAYPVRRIFGSGLQSVRPARTRDEPSDTSAESAEPAEPAASKASLALLREGLKAVPGLPRAVNAARAGLRLALRVWPGEAAFTLESFRRLRDVDVLLIAGSGQFTDEWNGPWAFPFTHLRWSLLARAAGARLAVVSVGAGVIEKRLSKAFYRICLALCDYISFRDERTRDLMREMGFPGESEVFPDLAHGHEALAARAGRRRSEGTRPVVGINVAPVLDADYWPTGSAEAAARYRAGVASFAQTLIGDGYEVLFFSTHPGDQAVIQAIAAELAERGQSAAIAPFRDTVEGLADTMLSADYVLATRFHGVLLPLAMGIPTLAVSYNPKTPELMRQMGQGGYVLDFYETSGDRLLQLFRRLEAEADRVREQLIERAAGQRRALARQCERLARLIRRAAKAKARS
jgi:polysaccharide pyruvyl transferase WcaK-like protein